jgi:hypothetical protein
MKKEGAPYFARNIVWEKTDDVDFPYVAPGEGGSMKIRLNDFPAEPMYTLLADGAVICDFDDWPENWRRGPA